jgi:putative transcriptional regulator
MVYLKAGGMMIRSNLAILIAERQRNGIPVTYAEITETTGVSSNTLSRLANNKTEMVRFSTLDALCKFFDCTVCDLLEYVPDKAE